MPLPSFNSNPRLGIGCHGSTGAALPNLFIVGAGKAGTSALYSYLRLHPDIFMSPIKEPNFFCADLHFRIPRLSNEDYAQLFATGRYCQYRGEASVSYLLSASSASGIRTYSPDAKIIIMVRNPIEVMQARHAQNVVCGDEDIFDFNEALDAEPARRSGYRVPDSATVVEWLFYREWVNFSEQICRYYDEFPRDQIFVGVYDDFRHDTRSFYKSLLDFLQLPAYLPDRFEFINRRRKVRSYPLHRMLYGDSSALNIAVKYVLPSRKMRRYLYRTLMSLNTAYAASEPHHRLPLPVRARLIRDLSPEITRLGILIGRDLTHWIRS